ncbi:MAG: hypothetical protein K2J30_05320, partial [Clostridia bacterium]|nr:hypothetical protein [Clostridia bacterium]
MEDILEEGTLEYETPTVQPAPQNNKRKKANLKEQITLHSMLVPGVVLATIFMIVPMIGIIMAFEKYEVTKGFFGSQWVGFYNFSMLFNRPDFWDATFNTVIIALWKIIF